MKNGFGTTPLSNTLLDRPWPRPKPTRSTSPYLALRVVFRQTGNASFTEGRATGRSNSGQHSDTAPCPRRGVSPEPEHHKHLPSQVGTGLLRFGHDLGVNEECLILSALVATLKLGTPLGSAGRSSGRSGPATL